MTEHIGSILLFVGLASISSALAILVGMLALHIRLPFRRNRNLPRELESAEVRKITYINDPLPTHCDERREVPLARFRTALFHEPLPSGDRFRRMSDKPSRKANWN